MIIRIQNDAFNVQSNKRLSPDEVITYSVLFKYHNVDHEFATTIDLLDQILVFKKGNSSENKSYIRDIIVSLQTKEYINCNIDEFIEYSKLIVGKVNNIDKGYSGVDSVVLNELLREDLYKGKLKLYIYADINRFSEGNKLSYNLISSKCNYFNSIKNHSPKTIQKIIDQMDGKLM